MAEPIGSKKHSLVDHLMGEGGLHVHADGDYDHDHDHDDIGEYDVEGDALWQQDHIQLVSVGIDIGSSGTQGSSPASTCAAWPRTSPAATSW